MCLLSNARISGAALLPPTACISYFAYALSHIISKNSTKSIAAIPNDEEALEEKETESEKDSEEKSEKTKL